MSPSEKTRLYSGIIPAVAERPATEINDETPGRSYTLIAVRTREGIVCVRNCHRRAGKQWVENIGAVLGLRENTQLRTTVERHAIVHEPPFRLRVPCPNFMRDLSPVDYEGAMAAAETLKDTKWQRADAEKQETPFSLLLESYWEEIGLYRPWTSSRLSLLAAGLSLTREELAQLAGTSSMALSSAMTTDGASGFNRATLLWLFYLEQFVQWVRFGRQPTSIFPENLLAAHPAGRTGMRKWLPRFGSKGLGAAVKDRISSE